MKNLLGQDQTAEITSSDSDFSEEDEYDYSLQDEEVLVPKVKPWDVFEVSDSFIIFCNGFKSYFKIYHRSNLLRWILDLQLLWFGSNVLKS